MTPLQTAQAWAAQLASHGVRSGCNPKDVAPPCVLFTPPDTVDFDLGCGGTGQLRALVLVGGPGQFEAWQALEVFLPDVLDALPFTPDQLRTTTYAVDSSGPMPAYELSFTAAVDWSKP